MKYFLILLLVGLFAGSNATFFKFFKKKPILNIEKSILPVLANGAGLSPEDILLFNQVYTTNGFGYYPVVQHQPEPQQIIATVPYTIIPQEPPVPNFYYTPEIPVTNEIVTTSGVTTIDQGLPKIPEQSIHFKPLEVPEAIPIEEVAQPQIDATVNIVPVDTAVIETELPKEEIPVLSTQYGPPDTNNENIMTLPNNGVPLDFQTGAYLTTKYPSPLFVTPPEQANNGEYSNAYVLSDGTKVFEEGHLIKSLSGNEVIVKSGHYEYITDDGKRVEVKWIADENGFRILE